MRYRASNVLPLLALICLCGCGVAAIGVVVGVTAFSSSGSSGGHGTTPAAGPAFRAVAFCDSLLTGYGSDVGNQSYRLVWVMGQVAAGHTDHMLEISATVQGAWVAPTDDLYHSGQAISTISSQGGTTPISNSLGPGVAFSLNVTANQYYRIRALTAGGETVYSNVVYGELAFGYTPGSISMISPPSDSDPLTFEIVGQDDPIMWAPSLSASSYLLVLFDNTYDTVVELTATAWHPAWPTGTVILLGTASLELDVPYAAAIVGLDEQGWGIETNGDPDLGAGSLYFKVH